MPSTEMLKKLLEEFNEKEAHTREEINVINTQIEELEWRIVASQEKLESVAVDKEKVKTMMARYASTDWVSVSPQAAEAAAVLLAAAGQATTQAQAGGNGSGSSRRRRKEVTEETQAASQDQQSAKITMPSPRISQTRLKALTDQPIQQTQAEVAQQQGAAAQANAANASGGLFISEAQPELAAPIEEPPRASEQPFTFNNLFSNSPDEDSSAAVFDEVPNTPLPASNDTNTWSQSLSTPASSVKSPASALSPGSFFSDEDDDDMLSVASAGVASAGTASGVTVSPFGMAGKPDAQTESGLQETAAAEAAQADPYTGQPSAQQAAPAQEGAQAPSWTKENDDTVKSINDALRGLFR